MADIIRMPEILAGAAEAAIQTWLVKPGDFIAVDQPLAEIETDKAVVELTAEVSGTVGRLLSSEGDSVTVGEPIVVLLAVGESADAIDAALTAANVDTEVAPSTEPLAVLPEPEIVPTGTRALAPEVSSPALADQAAIAPATTAQVASERIDGRRRFASPLVRKLAAQAGVDLADVPGSGPQGRIVRRDLDRYVVGRETDNDVTPTLPLDAVSTAAQSVARSVESSADYEDVPLSRMRKAIARRLTESKSTVPHFYLVAECRVDELLKLRETVNQNAPRKISVNDFVLKAVAGALVDVPAANAIWNGDSIRRFSSVDISVAVATDGGLTTPVLRDVQRQSLSEISATVAELAVRGREGRLKQHELEGGSFSVSNLGMYGTSQFSAILNPPQSGILAVGAARPRPVVDSDGALTVGHVMTVTLSADHRVLDGAVAAEWLAAFQQRIENPFSILI